MKGRTMMIVWKKAKNRVRVLIWAEKERGNSHHQILEKKAVMGLEKGPLGDEG